MIRFVAPALLLLTAAAPPVPSPAYDRAIAAGYKAAFYCSGMFNTGRTPKQIDAEELTGIYPEYATIVPTLTAEVDAVRHQVRVAFAPDLPPRIASWSPGEGCTTQPIGVEGVAAIVGVGDTQGRERPAASGPLPADPRPWPLGDAGIAPRPSAAMRETITAGFDGRSFGAGAHTIGVVVVRDGRVIGERYAAGWGPFVANRTWSAAKSIAGSLVGMAGMKPAAIAGVLPDWGRVDDPRSRITLDNLLRMASGLHSDTAGNRTDAIYFGGTSVDEQAPGWPLEARPGTRFRYANDDILLAVLAMRRTLGEERYGAFPATALFEPLGMRHTVAEADWRGNYLLSSQVWSTARDLARLGQFWLQDGVWQGRRLLPEGWMRYMTTPSGPQPVDGPGYGATMWLFGPKQGLPEGSYAAQGNRGQFVMVVPSERLVVVRRGEDPGAARFDIAAFTAHVIAALRR